MGASVSFCFNPGCAPVAEHSYLWSPWIGCDLAAGKLLAKPGNHFVRLQGYAGNRLQRTFYENRACPEAGYLIVDRLYGHDPELVLVAICVR